MEARGPLSLGCDGVEEEVPARELLGRIAAAGFRWVQLSATRAGFRPRDLDASGRRDLSSALSRSSLRLSGLDVWIPPEHFSDAAKVERAMEAVVAAAAMLREMLQRGAALPGAAVGVVIGESSAAALELARHADRLGVQIADHAVRPHASLAVGLDPAGLLLAGQDAIAGVFERGSRLASARLSDASMVGRCVVGTGRLDVMNYGVALGACGFGGPIVVDVRGLERGLEAGLTAKGVWERALRLPGEVG